jgi:hypothetical protein
MAPPPEGRLLIHAAVELAGVTGPSSIRLQQVCRHRDSSKFFALADANAKLSARPLIEVGHIALEGSRF